MVGGDRDRIKLVDAPGNIMMPPAEIQRNSGCNPVATPSPRARLEASREARRGRALRGSQTILKTPYPSGGDRSSMEGAGEIELRSNEYVRLA